MSIAGPEIKQALRKLEFPLNSKEALAKIGQLICGRSPNIKQMDLALDLMSEFVFCEVDKRGTKRKPFSAIAELQLLEVLIDYLNEMSSDSSRNSVFLTLFSGSTATQRLGVLSKLISIAMGVNAPKILISASTWMQQLGNTSTNSCKLAEVLVNDYYILVPGSKEQLSPLPTESPQFTANFLTAVGELYFTETRTELAFPPKCLLETIVTWIGENHKLCIAAQLMQSPLPPGAIAMEATTPIAALLKWCILAPIYKQDNELYCKLHLELLNSIIEIPVQNPPRAISTQHLSVPISCICRYTVELQKPAEEDNTIDKDALIRNDVDLQLTLDRFAQCIQVALSVSCVYGNVDDFINQLSQLPQSRLLRIVINKHKQNE